MKHEFSAGVVVYYQRAGKREYLLLHYASGHWDFPKGHMEGNESKQETALRELQEETGITTIKLNPDFNYAFSYFFTQPKTKELIKKTVYFFAGAVRSKQVTLSCEHIGYIWLPFKEAYEQVTYTNAQDLLQAVDKHLRST